MVGLFLGRKDAVIDDVYGDPRINLGVAAERLGIEIKSDRKIKGESSGKNDQEKGPPDASPAFQPSDFLTEAGERGYAAAASTCVRPGPTVPLEDVLKVWPERAKVEAAEEWPTMRFTHPVFVGIGLADSAAPPHAQYSTATAACRAGSIVETHYYPDKDHGGAVNASLVDSVPFVTKAFAGTPIAGNCATLEAPPVAAPQPMR